jgi:hypothetical protein
VVAELKRERDYLADLDVDAAIEKQTLSVLIKINKR